MYRLTLIAAVMALTACATPEERCIPRATPDFEKIDAEIAETQANIERGYRIEHSGVNLGVDFCNQTGHASICVGGDRELTSGPIPINSRAEREKLRRLRAQRVEMQARLANDIRRCRGMN